MPTTHVLTVNPTTFKIHLNYMFGGTGQDGVEHNGGALADIFGIREGDTILFYVTGNGFYGFFEPKVNETGSIVFYEKSSNQYLDSELGSKTLTYRLFIKPSEFGVYSLGVREWDAIENPNQIKDHSVYNMQWSWIFKKLSGNRGCTAITPEEFELLKSILVSNNRKLGSIDAYDFDNGMIHEKSVATTYMGNFDVVPRTEKSLKTIRLEEDLRICFTALAGKDKMLDAILDETKNGKISFISNETKCSFGEKSIDLMFFTDQNKCILIELKNSFDITNNIINQVSGYARWISSYKINLNEIIPILVIREADLVPKTSRGKYYKFLTPKDKDKNVLSPWYSDKIMEMKEAVSKFSSFKEKKVSELKIFSFTTDVNNELQGFTQII